MKRTLIAAQALGISLAGSLAALFALAAQQAPSVAALAATELAGKKLFLQRCSICHLPPLNLPQDPDPQPFGPRLNGYIKGTETEIRAREAIRNGTRRMPGFRYGLEPKEIDALIAYLKTLS
ncbi:cytochrome c [Acidobacteria bacterium AH-259-D05]|nr:cytochrome c [Acidobacteria bacterium AH-259-D05]